MKKYILPVIILAVITIVTLGCGGHGADDYITVSGDAPVAPIIPSNGLDTPVIPTDNGGSDIPIIPLDNGGLDAPITPNKIVLWEGSGTEEDPYLVPDADHLDDIRNKSLSACYKQTAHISLKKTRIPGYDWHPIGEGSHPDFTGKYDGNGYRIVGLFVKSNDIYSGLFGHITEAEINNLIIENADVVGEGCVGVFVGRADNSIISNCYAFGSTVQGNLYCGGIVGQLKGSKIINCCVDQSEVSGNYYVGGLAGSCMDLGSSKAIVDNCYVNDSKVNGNINVGAIIGEVSQFRIWCSFVINCFASGDMIVKGAKLSSETDGLIETIVGGATVTPCYYWKNGYKQGTTTGWTDWDLNIWNIPSTVPCLPTLRIEQEPPSAEWYAGSEH